MDIEIRVDPVKGRGVFAKKDFPKDALIESCELIVLKMDEVQGILERYVYEFSKGQAALALGNGSLYNHSRRANCIVEINRRKRRLEIRARRKIKAGEELTVNYHYDAATKKKFNIKD